MHVTIAAIGKMKRGSFHDLYHNYNTRLSWNVTLHELEDRRSKTSDKDREAALLLDALPKDCIKIAMDEKGKTFSSQAFAQQCENWQHTGKPVAFLIGGADGHGAAVKKEADLLFSLGSMTWPHMLARVLLIEQLYRASCILQNHPYHRE